MAAIRLTQRRVDTLRPRKTVRNIRDAELKGYGVRITPSGKKRYFIHSQHRGHRVWKIVGDAAVMTEADARVRARSMLAALRDDRDIEVEASGDALFETVAEEVLTRYGRRWKPRTLAVNRYYLQKQILPFFASRPIAEITREEVQRWFRSLHGVPAAANRSAPILSIIMQQAEAWGYRPDGGNPAGASGATGRSGPSASCRLSVNGGGIMLHRERQVGLGAAAQKCATDAPLSVWAGAGDVWGGYFREIQQTPAPEPANERSKRAPRGARRLRRCAPGRRSRRRCRATAWRARHSDS